MPKSSEKISDQLHNLIYRVKQVDECGIMNVEVKIVDKDVLVEVIDQLEARIEELEKQQVERITKNLETINGYSNSLKEDSLEEVIIKANKEWCNDLNLSPDSSKHSAKAVRKWIKDRLPKKKTTATIAGITASDCIFNHCLDTVNQNLGLNEGSENEQ